MIDVFCMLLYLNHTTNKSKTILSKVPNIKSFIDSYDWRGVKLPTVIGKNNQSLFEKNNTETALILSHADAVADMIGLQR